MSPRRGTQPSPLLYLHLLRVGPLVALAYRGQMLLALIWPLANIYLLYSLWTAVYRPGTVMGGMTLRQVITYSVLAALGNFVQGLGVDSPAQRVSDGSVVYLLLRPVPVLRYYLSLQLGLLGYGLLWYVPLAAAAWALGLVAPPSGWQVVPVFLASWTVGGVVGFYLDMFVQLWSFWTIRVTGVGMVYRFFMELLGGALVPIWFFPPWLRKVALWLPFQAAANIPLSLYVGRLPLAQAGHLLLEQLLWVGVLASVMRVLLGRGIRRIHVQGG